MLNQENNSLLNNNERPYKEVEFVSMDTKQVVKVYTTISLEERCNIVDKIVDMMFTDRDSIDGYCPHFKALAEAYSIITYCTDYKFLDDVEGIWAIIRYSNLYTEVMSVIGDDVRDILEAASEKVEAIKNNLCNKSSLDMLVEGLLTLGDFAAANFNQEETEKAMGLLKNLEGTNIEDVVKAIFTVKENNNQ